MLHKIVLKRGHTNGQRTAVAVGAQSHVNPVDVAVLRLLLEHLDEALAEALEELLVVQAAAGLCSQ